MTIDIHKGEMICLEARKGEFHIETLSGRVWLTQTSSPIDVVLGGDDFHFVGRGKGKVVIESLTDNSRVQITIP